MRMGTRLLVVGVVACGGWIASGVGANIGKSALRPGGEAGWYFSCRYFAPHRSFEVNYSDAARAPAGASSFFEPRSDCPVFAHQSRATAGWRH